MSGSALLVMDVQVEIAARVAAGDPGYLDRLAAAIAAARTAAIPVAYVTISFRPGYPEVSPNNLQQRSLLESERLLEGAAGSEIHPLIAPRPADPIVLKKRVSAFAGSDLDMLLRGLRIDHLVLTGLATSGVVLSTLRDAADRDFRQTVLADACADADAEVHRVLCEKVFPRQAEVTTVAAWAASLST